jgi:hypothetical protein
MSFSDYLGDATSFLRETAEAQLAYAIGEKNRGGLSEIGRARQAEQVAGCLSAFLMANPAARSSPAPRKQAVS